MMRRKMLMMIKNGTIIVNELKIIKRKETIIIIIKLFKP